MQTYIIHDFADAPKRNKVNTERMSDDQFIQYNKDQYNLSKDDHTRVSYENDPPEWKSYGYYIISIEWMGMWRNFVNGRGGRPTEIDNSVLVKKIETERKRLGYPAFDNDLNL